MENQQERNRKKARWGPLKMASHQTCRRWHPHIKVRFPCEISRQMRLAILHCKSFLQCKPEGRVYLVSKPHIRVNAGEWEKIRQVRVGRNGGHDSLLGEPMWTQTITNKGGAGMNNRCRTNVWKEWGEQKLFQTFGRVAYISNTNIGESFCGSPLLQS